jgi:hypothetical protein
MPLSLFDLKCMLVEALGRYMQPRYIEAHIPLVPFPYTGWKHWGQFDPGVLYFALLVISRGVVSSSEEETRAMQKKGSA